MCECLLFCWFNCSFCHKFLIFVINTMGIRWQCGCVDGEYELSTYVAIYQSLTSLLTAKDDRGRWSGCCPSFFWSVAMAAALACFDSLGVAGALVGRVGLLLRCNSGIGEARSNVLVSPATLRLAAIRACTTALNMALLLGRDWTLRLLMADWYLDVWTDRSRTLSLSCEFCRRRPSIWSMYFSSTCLTCSCTHM